jgi:hypothetical protein
MMTLNATDTCDSNVYVVAVCYIAATTHPYRQYNDESDNDSIVLSKWHPTLTIVHGSHNQYHHHHYLSPCLSFHLSSCSFVVVAVIDNSNIIVDSIEWYDKQYFAIGMVELHMKTMAMMAMMMTEIRRRVVTTMRDHYYHAASWIDS